MTVGQFLEELKAKADLNPGTLEGYAIAFRSIVADIFQVDGNRFDYRGGGCDHWIEKINAVRLEAVTPEKVQAWKRAFIARAGDDPCTPAQCPHQRQFLPVFRRPNARTSKRGWTSRPTGHSRIRPNCAGSGKRITSRSS